MFTSGKGGSYVAEKAESTSGWLFPVGDEVNELGYNHMFTDMFDAIENERQPNENFYDGYVVNAILDAAYASAAQKNGSLLKSKNGEVVAGKKEAKQMNSYDENYYLIKEEVLPSGEKKIIIKNKKTGSIEVR